MNQDNIPDHFRQKNVLTIQVIHMNGKYISWLYSDGIGIKSGHFDTINEAVNSVIDIYKNC